MDEEYVAKDDRKDTKMKVSRKNFMAAKAKAFLMDKKLDIKSE